MDNPSSEQPTLTALEIVVDLRSDCSSSCQLEERKNEIECKDLELANDPSSDQAESIDVLKSRRPLHTPSRCSCCDAVLSNLFNNLDGGSRLPDDDAGTPRAVIKAERIHLVQNCRRSPLQNQKGMETMHSSMPSTLVGVLIPPTFLQASAIFADSDEIESAKGDFRKRGSILKAFSAMRDRRRPHCRKYQGSPEVATNCCEKIIERCDPSCPIWSNDVFLRSGNVERHFDSVSKAIHPCLSQLRVRAIITTFGSFNDVSGCIKPEEDTVPRNAKTTASPADLVIMEVVRENDDDSTHRSDVLLALSMILNEINGEAMSAAPFAVIKAFPVSRVRFRFKADSDQALCGKISSDALDANSDILRTEIPACAVCLHRIEPFRLGLPLAKRHHLCSHKCAAESVGQTSCANGDSEYESPMDYCSNRKFLSSWPVPACCKACAVINGNTFIGMRRTCYEQGACPAPLCDTTFDGPKYREPCCYECGMKETLWICLTCGIAGCGRYSQGHAEKHYYETCHPFSLELATHRIWDYVEAEFVQRNDLVKCPISAPSGMARHQRQFCRAFDVPNLSFTGSDHAAVESALEVSPLIKAVSTHSYEDESSAAYRPEQSDPPKKAMMAGEEYEVLLQSALEDQAQHYEGEISRVRAELTAKRVPHQLISETEKCDIEALNLSIAGLRDKADQLARIQLEVQAQEAGHRASSQRLLREQANIKEELDKLKQQKSRERMEGELQLEELEQQVADLIAYLKFQQQINQNEELKNSKILSASKCAKKGGKKSRKFFRK